MYTNNARMLGLILATTVIACGILAIMMRLCWRYCFKERDNSNTDSIVPVVVPRLVPYSQRSYPSDSPVVQSEDDEIEAESAPVLNEREQYQQNRQDLIDAIWACGRDVWSLVMLYGAVEFQNQIVKHCRNQRARYRQDVQSVLLPFVAEEIAKIIMLYCCADDHILIPDNFEVEEFTKHWEEVESGDGLDPYNAYRNDHEVWLHDSVDGGGFLRCSRRGAITSRFGWIATTHCKLLLECEFQFSNSNDFMTFTLRSNGKRSNTRWKVQFGILEMANCVIRVVQNGWSGPARIVIGDDDGNVPPDSSKRWMAIPNPQPNELINVRIIYDGQNVEFECSFRGNTYRIQTRLADYGVNGRINRRMCKIAMNNRECPGNVVDITKLRVSMICDEEN